MAFTSEIILSTGSKSFCLGLRHAAPIQNRLAPLSLAARAAANTSSMGINGSFSTSVWYRAACGQYPQSSEQPPVLIESKVLTCTPLGSKFSRCTVCARCIKSLNGNSNSSTICATLQRFSVSTGGTLRLIELASTLLIFNSLMRHAPLSYLANYIYPLTIYHVYLKAPRLKHLNPRQ